MGPSLSDVAPVFTMEHVSHYLKVSTTIIDRLAKTRRARGSISVALDRWS
jgi:hypothetical protein